ncbi:MAG: hypothetical protein SPL49_04450 [Oribacterium sp.]|nr:hypothetical protein [Oribacterium sp.]
MYVHYSKFITKKSISICATFLVIFLLVALIFPFDSYAAGWYRDEATGIWTYVVLSEDGGPGYSLKKGWHADADGYTYYLHDETGHMLTGYHVIGDKLCYFKEEPNQGNYWQHEDTFWYYQENGEVPYGALIMVCDWPSAGSESTASVNGPGMAS